MTIVKKYPTIIASNPGAWIVTAKLLNIEDGVCGARIFAPYSTNEYQVFFDPTSFGFSIPNNAIITRITFGSKAGCDSSSGNPTYVYLVLNLGLYTPGLNYDSVSMAYVQGIDCDTVEWSSKDWTNIFPSVADLNTGHFVFYLALYSARSGYYANGYSDASYIEVEYHLPAPPPSGTGISSNGLISLVPCIAAWKRRRKRRISLG